MKCPGCSKEIPDNSTFCSHCGSAIDQSIQTQQEQAFLNTTHRILRWERTAWSIGGKVCLILGIILAAIFALIALLSFGGLSVAGSDGAPFAVFGIVYFVYALVYGGSLIGIGIINNIASKKITKYLDAMHTDFKPAYDRCGSIGMIIFTYFFNNIALVFFVINFVRIKCSRNLIHRILARQQQFLPHETR